MLHVEAAARRVSEPDQTRLCNQTFAEKSCFRLQHCVQKQFPFAVLQLGRFQPWAGFCLSVVLSVFQSSSSTPRQVTALHCTALHCTALHCTALHGKHCTARRGEGRGEVLDRCTALHCTERRDAVHSMRTQSCRPVSVFQSSSTSAQPCTQSSSTGAPCTQSSSTGAQPCAGQAPSTGAQPCAGQAPLRWTGAHRPAHKGTAASTALQGCAQVYVSEPRLLPIHEPRRRRCKVVHKCTSLNRGCFPYMNPARSGCPNLT